MAQVRVLLLLILGASLAAAAAPGPDPLHFVGLREYRSAHEVGRGADSVGQVPHSAQLDEDQDDGDASNFSPRELAKVVVKDFLLNMAPDNFRRVLQSETFRFSAKTAKDAVLREMSPSQRALLEVLPVVASASVPATPEWLIEALAVRDRASAMAEQLETGAKAARERLSASLKGISARYSGLYSSDSNPTYQEDQGSESDQQIWMNNQLREYIKMARMQILQILQNLRKQIKKLFEENPPAQPMNEN